MSRDRRTQTTSQAGKGSQFKSLLPNLNAGLVNGTLIIIFQSAYAALIFSGHLAGYISNGIGYMLFGAFVMGTIVALTSSYPATVTAPQDAPTAILALTVAAMTGGMAVGGNTEMMFLTTVAAITLTSVFTGTFLMLLGRFKLGNLIRFIPYPVIGGFLAGTGWLLVRGAIRVMSNVTPGMENLPLLFQGEAFLKWLAGMLFAIILFGVLRVYRHFLVMPAMILAAIIIFYLVLFATDTPVSQASARGWLLGKFSGGVRWEPLSLSSLAQVNWPAILRQAGSLGSIIFISVISLLLNASGLELLVRREIDLNRELQSTGLANLVAGLGGSAVGYLSLSLSVLGYRIGARNRVASLASTGLCGLTLLSGVGISSYFPKPLLGGLLLYLGLSFLVDWLYTSWFRLPKIEYFLVVLILITIGMLGLLEGMALGILIAGILFVVNYSRINVVKHVLSGTTFQSNVDRALPYQRLLREKGDQLYILKLQGYIFFGTANDLLETLKRRMNDPQFPRLHFVVLDFRLVTGLDSSALNSFVKMKLFENTLGVKLVFTGLSATLRRQFDNAGLTGEQKGGLPIFPDLDHGVEWCENRILLAERAPFKEDSFADQPASEFMSVILALSSTPGENAGAFESTASRIVRYMERQEVDAGHYLIRQGELSVNLYLLLAGQVTALLEESGGKAVRLRSMGPGTVVGELGVYLGLQATASVVTDQKCLVLRLSLEKLRKMETDDPPVAAAFHKFIARIIGERLINSTKTLQALMD